MIGTKAAAVLALLLLAPSPAAAQTAAPVVAVFDVHDRSGKFSPEQLDQLTDYLSTKIAEGGVYVVVPRAQVKSALESQKQESYKQCYDDACQIEIGRELAAQKSLLTQIVQVGTQCAVTVNLFDLRRGASERAASKKTMCDQDALVTALEEAAANLREFGRGQAPVPVAKVEPAPATPREEKPATALPGPPQPDVPPRVPRAPEPAPAEDDSSVVSSPIFWIVVVGLAVGAGIAVAVATSGGGSGTQVIQSGGSNGGL